MGQSAKVRLNLWLPEVVYQHQIPACTLETRIEKPSTIGADGETGIVFPVYALFYRTKLLHAAIPKGEELHRPGGAFCDVEINEVDATVYERPISKPRGS